MATIKWFIRMAGIQLQNRYILGLIQNSRLYLFPILMLIAACSGSDSEKKPGSEVSEEIRSDTLAETMKTIVFFGNSLSAGYGLDPSEAFPALIQKKIDSLNLPYRVVNAGVSGETTSGGNSRIDWILRQPVDIFVLELGGNDGLRGIPLTETKKNLQAIMDKVRGRYPEAKILLAGMQIPPNMGRKYTDEFRDLYPQLAKNNNVSLVPFLLEGVGGEARYNQSDGIHPTAEGHMIVADNVWVELVKMLEPE